MLPVAQVATVLMLCQREPVASPVSCADFDSDALPLVPLFRQSRPSEVESGVAGMDAEPAAFALGVLHVACYCE